MRRLTIVVFNDFLYRFRRGVDELFGVGSWSVLFVIPVRRKLTQVGHNRGENRDNVVDVFVGRVATEAETDRAVDRREGDMHREQNVRRFERAGRASRTAGRTDSFSAELEEHPFAFDVVARDV